HRWDWQPLRRCASWPVSRCWRPRQASSMTSIFRPLVPLAARWRLEDGTGLEHLNLKPSGDTILADGIIIGNRGGVPYGARYRAVMDKGWATLSLDIETTDGRGLHLVSNGAGHWSGADGNARPEFDGCIDIDLAGSPFTNTLPIRRTELTPANGA